MINIATKSNSSFPLTPTVLWDHKPAGPSEWIHILQFRSPSVIFEEKALRLAHHFTEQSANESYSCHFTGVVNIDADGEGISINIDQFVANVTHNTSTHLAGGITVPCFLKKNNAKPQSSSSDYGVMIKEVMGRCRGKTRVDLAELLSARVYASYHDNRTSFMFHMDTDVLLPSVRLRATPVSPVPILATALTRNLCSPMNLSSIQGLPKTGYLSMDGARHLLLVLESDPKAPTLPLIGIWVAGTTTVQHPFVWAAGVRYAMNASLLEKVCRPPEPFLVVLYSPHRSAPEFFECVVSSGASQQPVCLLTHHDVFQLSKETTGRMTTPVEMELTLVESGPRKDMLDAALEQSAALNGGLHADEGRGVCDDTVPRSMPAPIKSHISPVCVKPSVPDVTILFDAHDGLSLPSSNQEESGHQRTGMNGSNGAHVYEQPARQQPTGYRLPQQQHVVSSVGQQSYQNGGSVVHYGAAEVNVATDIYAAYAPAMNCSDSYVPQQYRPSTQQQPVQRTRPPAPRLVQSTSRGVPPPPPRFAGNDGRTLVYDAQQQQQHTVGDAGHYQQQQGGGGGGIRLQQPMMYVEPAAGGVVRNARQSAPHHAMMAATSSAGQWQQQQAPLMYGPTRPQYVATRYGAPHMRPVVRQTTPQNQGYPANATTPQTQRPGLMKHSASAPLDNYSVSNAVSATPPASSAAVLRIPQSDTDASSPISDSSKGGSFNSKSPVATGGGGSVAALSPEVMQLLQHQDEQLRLLREQVALLLSKQDAREEAVVASATTANVYKPPGELSADNNKENRGPLEMVDVAIGDSISVGKTVDQGVLSPLAAPRRNCSKAVNTSTWLNSIPTPSPSGPAAGTSSSATSQTTTKKHHSKHRHHRREKEVHDSSSATEYEGQGRDHRREHRTRTKARRPSDDVSWTSYATNEVETGESSTAEDVSGGADDSLSLSRSQIEMKVNRNNDDVSVTSEIIVDLPAVSLSPEKSGNRSSSGYGGTEDSNRSPELGDSASIYLPHEQDPEMADQGQGHGAELLYVDQRRYYQNMLSGLQKMLSQQQQTPGSASEAEVNRLRRLATDAELCLQQQDEEVGATDDSIDVMRRTKERLAGLLAGLDVSVLGNTVDDTLRFEPSILLEPVYLPKVNYTSVYFDRSNDVSMEADAISLKYLSDEQLTAGARQLQRLPHPVSSVARERYQQQQQYPALFSATSGRPSADVDKSMYGSNPSMSFASRRYLERYGLSSAQQQQQLSSSATAGYHQQPQQLPTIEAASTTEYNFQQPANDWSRQQQTQIDASSAASTNLDDVWKMLMEQKQRNASFERRVPDETFSEPTSIHHYTPPDGRSMAASSLNASANAGRPSSREEAASKPLFYHSDGDSFHVLAKNTSTPASRSQAGQQRQLEYTPPPASSMNRRTRLSEGMVTVGRQERRNEGDDFSLNSGRRSLDNSAVAAPVTAPVMGHESAAMTAKSSLLPPERILDVERLRELPKLL